MSQIPEMMGGRTLTHDIPTTGDLQIVAGKGLKLSGQTALMTALTGATSLLAFKGEGIAMGDAAHTLLVTGTAAGGQTVITSNVLIVDPQSSGSTEDLNLPAEASCTGLLLIILNSGGEGIVIKDDGGATKLTLDTAQSGLLYCDGTTWRGFMGAIT
tara:strand:- start:66 stop:536 length:471 start_codon:yes stop_codon:yes gene_type:complete